MVTLPSFTTPATDELCKTIAKKSNGVCFLGFSRGKDSLCAWLNLKRYFKRVIPFHCTTYPGLKHIEDTLRYYEFQMDTRILRLVGEDLPMAVSRYMYQTLDEEDEISEMDQPTFSKLDIVEQLRYDFNFPRAWCAFGIAASDSIDRRIYCNRVKGRNPQNLTFYPCYDWPHAEILNAIKNAGLKVSGEYKYASRTLGGVPSATCNAVYKEHYPEDWQRIKAYYPLCEAKTLRERYLDRAYERRKAAGIVADESSEAADEESSAADMMTELGMGAGE